MTTYFQGTWQDENALAHFEIKLVCGFAERHVSCVPISDLRAEGLIEIESGRLQRINFDHATRAVRVTGSYAPAPLANILTISEGEYLPGVSAPP